MVIFNLNVRVVHNCLVSSCISSETVSNQWNSSRKRSAVSKRNLMKIYLLPIVEGFQYAALLMKMIFIDTTNLFGVRDRKKSVVWLEGVCQ